ncbi:histidine phosphatase family protein [Cellulomonas bogoriensis]|uniref:Phosphoglycerate mutase n=1 Tax=Cellulomonas bogoriensis 69B4 = DSM 16987 TaxID=1386082 RepID=A0A0A0BYY8_9CELL|nr:histidine phosphatase family protein [Cellulomonas bogoriensis]KGM13131.1 phosphoglycerate mutase [Cellulomonas bogoriensis 69B4 = DSM 16987]
MSPAVVLWRHGRTAYNLAGRLQGQVDIPLDEVGLRQADEAAEMLHLRHRPVRIVSSDLGRAEATAQALARRVGVPVQVDARLRERSFGEWEGLSAEEIRGRWPDEYAVWRAGHDPQRVGAETRAEVAQRVAAAVGEHAEDVQDGQTLAVVAHGAAITLGLTSLLGLDPVTWRGLVGLHNAHWSVLRRSAAGEPAWRLEEHNAGPAVSVAEWNDPGAALPSTTADALRR